MIKTRVCYAPVRKADGESEWLDLRSTSTFHDRALDDAKRWDAQTYLQDWARANPVVRVAKIRIEEVPYEMQPAVKRQDQGQAMENRVQAEG